ncbi:hypothetical protein KI810_10295 [Geobacter luticola]|uniref:Uncharacterized protein n=1 Tax=Geomobilimonas luticola TaxID=1114878 RepID=A0ABS5SDK1_9BACT|nr:hypothetical protein [Geomobilimonas luticola]
MTNKKLLYFAVTNNIVNATIVDSKAISRRDIKTGYHEQEATHQHNFYRSVLPALPGDAQSLPVGRKLPQAAPACSYRKHHTKVT